MHKYGAWDYSPEEYQQLMSRINVGMIEEAPLIYNNYEVIWGWDLPKLDMHAYKWRDITNSLVKYANHKVVTKRYTADESLKEYFENNPNSINIFWCSIGTPTKKKIYAEDMLKNVKNTVRSKNLIIFASWWNVRDSNWTLIDKTYNQEYEMQDENWIYSAFGTGANSDKNYDPDNHLMITIATNKDGDLDQTHAAYNSSRFPVGFHEKSSFAGRTFPARDPDYWWYAISESWSYATSYPTQLNKAMTGLSAQNFADIDNVDELLDMMRSTAGTDYIRYDLNGDWDTNDTVSIAQSDGSYLHQKETVPLQLISSGEVFRTYGMAINETGWKRPSIQLPTTIAPWQIVYISKWWYELPIFQAPGVEVNIDGEWIPFSNQYTDLIKTKNPAYLERRLNGDLLSQMWYKPWDTIQWTVQAVDDTWWWLKDISKSFTITMTDGADSIHTPTANNTSSTLWWHSISGQKLSKRPTKPWVYIHNGKKVVIK